MQDASARLTHCIPRLRRYARALVGDSAAADDLVHDTVQRGWLNLSSWRRASDLRPSLFKILHTLHLDQVHQPALRLVAPAHGAVPAAASAAALPRRRDLETALALLPVEQRAVLLLVALEEMRYQEVADTLGIPLGTVMSRLSRARERLRLLMLGQPVSAPLGVIK